MQEIIVVDDGPIDDIVNIVSDYGGKVRLLTQKNQGSVAARNLGIRLRAANVSPFWMRMMARGSAPGPIKLRPWPRPS